MSRLRDDYWLRNCHGFRVETPSGRLGLVEDVVYGAGPERPSALAVRGGILGRKLSVVPVDAVETIEPGRKRLTVGPRRP
jgi:hypothetical protein